MPSETTLAKLSTLGLTISTVLRSPPAPLNALTQGGVLATVGQGIGDASGSFQLCWTRPGRKVGTGFPLCKYGASSRQEALREEPQPLRQPDSSLLPTTLRCWGVYLNLNTRAAAILLTASDTGYPPAGHSVRRSTGRSPGATQLKRPQMLRRGPRSVDMFYQLPGPRSLDAGRMAG